MCVIFRSTNVINFSKSAASVPRTDIQMSGRFSQYVADNVDHNIRTLDGRGTTPELRRQQVVPRLRIDSASNVLNDAQIEIRYYKLLSGENQLLLYKKLPPIDENYDNSRKVDIMWKMSWPLRPQRHGWSETMQAICHGDYPGKASIHFLPMLDMDPTDMSCIFSTLHFVADENRRHGTVPILTFDQPLWWKSRTIILHEGENSELKPLVLILGGFHTTMSFLGCIGNIMGLLSGLKDVF